ncbi:MAG: acyltransferase [Chloroflexi bacterium]|nr:acyltransferase [Chloroflexota bacterium]
MTSLAEIRRGGASPARADPGGSHLPALDGLRGVAVLMVMFFHFVLVTRLHYGLEGTTAGAEGVIDWIADGGWAGVELFFVLSGFLITGILLRARETPSGYFRNFYARRALRIFPLYYATLFFIIVLLPLLATISSDEFARLQSLQLWHWTYTMNLWITATNGAGDTDVFATGHFWSLSVEEQFYLVWPAVVYVCGRRWLIPACIAIVIVSPLLRFAALAAGADPFVGYTFTPLRLDALAMGALLAAGLGDERSAARLRRHAPAAALLSLASLAAVVWWKGDLIHVDPRMLTFGLPALAALSASLILLATKASGGAVRSIAEWAPLRAAGRYSYALYILHWPIATWLVTVVDVPGLNDAHLAGRMLFVLVAGGVSMVCAWLSWHLFEQHFLRLKDRFREPRPASPAAPAAELVPAA